MLDAQSAAEVARQGTSGVWLDAGLITLIVTNVGLISRDLIRTRRNGTKPGTAPSCIEHGKKLAVVESKQTGYDSDIKEIKDDIKELLERVPKGK